MLPILSPDSQQTISLGCKMPKRRVEKLTCAKYILVSFVAGFMEHGLFFACSVSIKPTPGKFIYYQCLSLFVALKTSTFSYCWCTERFFLKIFFFVSFGMATHGIHRVAFGLESVFFGELMVF